MKSYPILLHLIVLNRLSALRPGSWKNAKGQLDIKGVGYGALLLVLGCVGLGFVVWIEGTLYTALKTIRHTELLPALALMVSMLGMLVMSFFYVLTSLYFSRDAKWMSYLPIRSSTLLGAKLTEIWAGEMLLNAVILLPAFILCGIHGHMDGVYYGRALLITLLSPLLPLAVITVLSSILVRLVRGASNSTAVMTGASLLFVLAVVGAEMLLLPKIPDDANALWFAQLLLSRSALLNTLTRFMPPVRWGVDALMGSYESLALFAGVSLAAIALVIALFGPRYLALCIRQTEGGRKKHGGKMGQKDYSAQTPFGALVQLEIRGLLRSSVNMTQCMAGGLIFPLMLALFLLGGRFSQELAVFDELIGKALAMVPATDWILIFTALYGFVTYVSPAACTAVSREGKRHAMLRTLPVGARTMLRAKLVSSFLPDILGIVLTTVVLVLAIPTAWWTIPCALALTAMLRYACVTLMLLVDCVRPVLHWTTEMQAVKQNLNVLFGMLVCIALLLIPGGAAALLLGASPWLRFAAVSAVLAMEAAAGGALLHTVGEKRYAAIESSELSA